MDERTEPGYWAAIPPEVRYDTRLTASAKLLYGEISALTDKFGYCWAANDYFERLYGLSTRTVIRMIQSLADAGYIAVSGGQTTRRRIYAGINPMAKAAADAENQEASAKNGTRNKKRTSAKNVTASAKNVTAIYNDTEDHDTPPKAPQGAGVSKSTPKWNPERFEAFWRYYPAIPDGTGHGRRPAKDRAARAWDKLRPDDATIAAMGTALRRQKESRQWRDGIGIPYASTWLNGRKWEEEIEELPRNAPASVGQKAAEEAIEWV